MGTDAQPVVGPEATYYPLLFPSDFSSVFHDGALIQDLGLNDANHTIEVRTLVSCIRSSATHTLSLVPEH